MCGRYNTTDDPLGQALLESLGVKLGKLPTRYNIAPTEYVPVVFERKQQRLTTEMRWWLVPSWSKGPSSDYAMFNARSESLGKSPAFRGPYKTKRCIIPASSFIEWQKTAGGKQPYLIEADNDMPLAFAGVWDCWRAKGHDGNKGGVNDSAEGLAAELYSCTIVTTQAASSFEHVHNRMPVMLAQEHFDLWLDTSVNTKELAPLFAPTLATPLRVSAISKHNNNARNKDAPEVIAKGEIIH